MGSSGRRRRRGSIGGLPARTKVGAIAFPKIDVAHVAFNSVNAVLARGVADRLAISAPRDDVRDVYAVSSLVLQLSNKPESFGRTVIEALALCRPVLGYDHGEEMEAREQELLGP